ncbi:MAG: NAD(P)H-hydrate dehydratase [Chloroflexi bacterium]|nr:NAD(P)H-hydrate dehydratase [Chloroflexota bacterium]
MKIVTVDEMRELERRSAEEGTTVSMLMDNAGLAFAQEVRRWRGDIHGCLILVLIGPGNNGGDGLVAARHLHDWGASVFLYLCTPRPENDPNLRLALERKIPFKSASEDPKLEDLKRVLDSAELVVDAVLGTGRSRPLEGTMKKVLEAVGLAREARSKLTIFALDLPTGLDADTGAVDHACLPSDITVTLAHPKPGLFVSPGAEKVGKLVVADIGIPPHLAQDIRVELMTPEWAARVLPKRPIWSHKGSFGKVLAVVGSINYVGAAYLACEAAARAGAGLVTLAIPRSLHPILAAKLTEVTYLPLPEWEPGVIHPDAIKDLGPCLNEYEVLLVGCGIGQHTATQELLRSLLFPGFPSMPRMVLDADALGILAKSARWWQRFEGEAVLTPHPGEMSRLRNISVREVQQERFRVAKEASSLWKKVVALKGAYTIVASPDGRLLVSPFANPGLASAGTGDVLAGTVVGLMAQGLPSFESAACGVYLHAAAGEKVRERLGDAGMLASDLLEALPLTMKGLKER